MKLFLDTSALAKRYVSESGSDLVVDLCGQASQIILSVVTPVELLSALNRTRREGKLAPLLYKKLKNIFAEDLNEATLVPLEESVVQKAIQYLETVPLRSLDSIQLASAKISHADLFISADKQQIRGAQVIGIEARLV